MNKRNIEKRLTDYALGKLDEMDLKIVDKNDAIDFEVAFFNRENRCISPALLGDYYYFHRVFTVKDIIREIGIDRIVSYDEDAIADLKKAIREEIGMDIRMLNVKNMLIVVPGKNTNHMIKIELTEQED